MDSADFPAVVDINDIITNTVGALLGYILKKVRLVKPKTTIRFCE